MKKAFIVILALICVPGLLGCNAMTGTLAGGGIGAGTGAIIGSATDNAGAGTAIGAGIGALTGLLVGAAMEQQQKQAVPPPPVVVTQAPAAPPPTLPAGGQVIVACPRCSQHVDVSGFESGSKVKCPVCNTIFTF
jgi:hypothetical protein